MNDFNYEPLISTDLAIKTLKEYKFKEKELVSKRKIDFSCIMGILSYDKAEKAFNILYTLLEANKERKKDAKQYKFLDAGWEISKRYSS